MTRPRKNPETPEQRERRDRLEDACRYVGLTQTAFCATHGFTIETLWKWMRDGDPSRPPRDATTKSTSSNTIAQALGVDPLYLRPGGPRLWAESVAPYVERPMESTRGVSPSTRYVLLKVDTAQQMTRSTGGCLRVLEDEARTFVRAGATGTTASIFDGQAPLTTWTKNEEGRVSVTRARQQ